MRDDIIHLAKHTFQQNYVRGKPLTHQGRSRSNNKVRHRRGENENKGNFIIRRIWEHQNDAIIEVRFGDTDCDPYNKDPMVRLIDL